MFLKSIHVKNFRCLDDVELSFEEEDGTIRKWTIILGENGTGKSTLLRAIALITSGSEALSDLLGEPSEWIRYKEAYCEISAVLVTEQLEERIISLRIERGDSRSTIIRRNTDSLELLDNALEHSNRNYFVAGFGASRRLSSVEASGDKTSSFWNVRAQSLATLFDPDATLNPLESWAIELDYQNENGLETVRSVLNSFLPSVKFKEIDKKRKQLLFEMSNGVVVPIRSLSDGYQTVAAWIGDLLYRITRVFKDYQSLLEARGLLLIDEVDLHLHPNWKRQLLSDLERHLPNFQFVVTTHSPMTAQQAGPGQLHYMTQKAGKIQIEQFTGNPRNLLINQLLMADAFGVESDASLEVEQSKDRYRQLRDKKRLSKREKEEFARLDQFLSEIPHGGRSNLHLQEEHAQLLQEIQRELQERKS